MPEPSKQEIEARAYQLWEKAGRPQDREEEFWHLAQQELRNENKSSPVRTPDTLCPSTYPDRFKKKFRTSRPGAILSSGISDPIIPLADDRLLCLMVMVRRRCHLTGRPCTFTFLR